jgi:hypothetical protein
MSDSYQVGNRYFKVDEGYDKKLYENTWGNVVIIIVVFIVFYVLNIVHFYGSLAFGTVHTVANMWYNVALFAFMIVFLSLMLISGHIGNNKKKRHDFYQEKIRDKMQEIRDQEAREAQKREQEMKLSKAKNSSRKPEETKRGMETHSDEELDNSALIRKNNQI